MLFFKFIDNTTNSLLYIESNCQMFQLKKKHLKDINLDKKNRNCMNLLRKGPRALVGLRDMRIQTQAKRYNEDTDRIEILTDRRIIVVSKKNREIKTFR